MANDNHFKTDMLRIRDEYIADTGRQQFSLAELGQWAVNNNRYDLPFANKVKHFCASMRGILQQETHIDRDGNCVRTWQCARRSIPGVDGSPEQSYLWADMRTAEPNFVLAAFAERFKASRADARKVQAEVASWNKFNRPSDFPPIQFDWDFTGEQGDEAPGMVG